MNLQNFEQHIDETIVDRGHAYYLQDLVTLESISGRNYCFQVEGSDIYEVTVTLNEDGAILDSYCDCPYTYGSVCKHEVAVYFELQDLIDDKSGATIAPEQTQQSLTEVLNGLSKDQLIRIVEELASEDTILKSRLMLQYSKQAAGQEVEIFKKLVRSIVHKHAGRRGFIGYRETGDFARELGDCLLQIEDSEDAVVALDLACILLQEAVEAFQYADDSSGDIGGLVEDTLEVIDVTVMEAVDMESGQRQELFEKLLKLCEHPMFEDWEEYQDILLNICTYFADDIENREVLIQKIESMIDEKTVSRYHNESRNRLLFDMIGRYGTAEEAEQFMQSRLHYSSFREQLINRNMVEKNYHQVIQLAVDGEKNDKERAGLVSRWKNYRYAAYKELSLLEEQRLLAKELFMDGQFDFYHELKALAEDPDQFYVQLKQELLKKTDWRARNLFQRLIEEENDTAELIVFIRKYPQTIEQYAGDLVDSYREEIQEMYREFINMKADRASNRKGYQDVCGTIRRYGKVVGKQLQQEIVKELREIYRRKTAFVDELGKV